MKMNFRLNHIWLILWIVVFVLSSRINITEILANKGINIIENEYYRFFTGLFVHVNVLHLVANVVTLYFVVDFLYGQVDSMKLLVFSAMVGIISNFIFSMIYRDSVSVGGSPIIFAMIGVLIALQLHSKDVARFTLDTLQGKWIVAYAILSNIPFFSGNISTLVIHGISLILSFIITSFGIKFNLI